MDQITPIHSNKLCTEYSFYVVKETELDEACLFFFLGPPVPNLFFFVPIALS